MSHNIDYMTANENCNRKYIQAQCDEVARHEDWQEGCIGVSPIKWLDNAPIQDSYEKAREYIKSRDNGWYACLAVRFKALDNNVSSKALETAKAKAMALGTKYRELSSAKHFADVKSEFIGCKECGSRIAVKYIDKRTDGNHCAVCGADLRPQTTIDKINKLYTDWQSALSKIETLKEELAKTKGKVMWLIKYEYHT